MPHTIQYRTVKAKWYDPRTWRSKTHREYRYLWDIDEPLRDGEFEMLVRSGCDKNGRGKWVKLDANSPSQYSAQHEQRQNE